MNLIKNRLIKIFANICKTFCYVYHFFLPKKRFTIPAYRAPRKKASADQRIPRIIWQTNFTDQATLPVYLNYLFNGWLSPTYEQRFVSTEARGEFIKENYPAEIFEAYDKIQIGAGQADYWRVLVLNTLGGIYIDIDAHTVSSLDKIIKPTDTEAYIQMRDSSLSNYFIASVPDNPNLQAVAKAIKENIDERKNTYSAFTMTGPGVFNSILDVENLHKVFYRDTCIQGSFTNEYFQYIDKPQGKWTKDKTPILKD